MPDGKQSSDLPKLRAFLRRRTRRRWGFSIAALVLIVLIAVADRRNLLLDHRPDFERYHGQTFRVVYVVDGDTVHIDQPDRGNPYTIVRLWGIDTPETARPDRDKPAEPFAAEATDFTTKAVLGQTVRLDLQPHRVRGTFGRLLAYIETDDGDLSAALLDAGLAEAVDHYEHDREADYADRADAARLAGRGMWADE